MESKSLFFRGSYHLGYSHISDNAPSKLKEPESWKQRLESMFCFFFAPEEGQQQVSRNQKKNTA